MTVVAIALPTLRLSDDETRIASELRGRLGLVVKHNRLRSDLYEGKHKAEDLGISIPPQLRDIGTTVGWPGTVVDVLEERLEFQGWNGNSDLDRVYRENDLGVESGRGHLDSLIYGCGFVTVGRGADDEPEVLITVESTESCTAEWDYRARRVKYALSQTRNAFGQVILETLYLPNETITIDRTDPRNEIVERDNHKLGRPPVAQMFNRERASDLTGRSEITKPVIYLTDAGIRTLLGMEVNREFYTSPKFWALNAEPEVFGLEEGMSPDELFQRGFSVAMGRLNAVPPQFDDEGNVIKVEMGQFNPAAPTPYIEQMRAYTQLLSAETGIPASYLGFVTDNPASADSIRQLEHRLVKRAERRQASFGQAWRQVAYLALLVRSGGEVDPAAFRDVSVKWRDAATPTRAASADEAAKLIGSKVLSPDSTVTYDRVGLTPEEQRQLQLDKASNPSDTARLADALTRQSAPAV